PTAAEWTSNPTRYTRNGAASPLAGAGPVSFAGRSPTETRSLDPYCGVCRAGRLVSARVTIFAVRAPQMVAATTEARVAPIELFFDLVFVFGLTQITTLMAYDVSAHGIARGLLVWGLPMVDALCYFAFRGLHLVLFWVLSRTDH